MRKLIVSEFVTLDGVMQAPGGKDEDRDGGFEHGGWDEGCRCAIAGSPDVRDPRRGVRAHAIWLNTTIIRDKVIESVRALKAEPGKNILTDGSSQLVHALLEHDPVDELHLLLYPLTLGSGKRVFPDEAYAKFRLTSAKPYPSGVVGLHYARQRS